MSAFARFHTLGLNDVFVFAGRVFQIVNHDRIQRVVGTSPEDRFEPSFFDPWELVQPLVVHYSEPDGSIPCYATLDNYDGPGSPIGYGPTQREALIELALAIESDAREDK